MRITIVTGFFLPVPPVRGGAIEKTWHGLAALFAAEGHSVTFVSRSWPTMPQKEVIDGVTYLRLKGFDHTRFLGINLILDFFWAIKVASALPDGDVVICNTVSLPALLPWTKPSAGRVAVALGRLPKGQIRFYRKVARIYAPTRVVSERIAAERAQAAAVTRVVGYPIDWKLLHDSSAQTGEPVSIGYVGRLNPEKGIELLLAASAILAGRANLPDWKLVLLGPSSINEGGGGADWIESLEVKYGPALAGRLVRLAPEFDRQRLATGYGKLDIFCYPSLSETGETFGVSVAEAMAAGCAAVVSALDCFKDLVSNGQTGLVFDHNGPQAASHLADCLERMLKRPDERRAMAARGQRHIQKFDIGEVSRFILDDLMELTGAGLKKQI